VHDSRKPTGEFRGVAPPSRKRRPAAVRRKTAVRVGARRADEEAASKGRGDGADGRAERKRARVPTTSSRRKEEECGGFAERALQGSGLRKWLLSPPRAQGQRSASRKRNEELLTAPVCAGRAPSARSQRCRPRLDERACRTGNIHRSRVALHPDTKGERMRSLAPFGSRKVAREANASGLHQGEREQIKIVAARVIVPENDHCK